MKVQINFQSSKFNKDDYWRKNRWDLVQPNSTVVVHPFDGGNEID
jgi:hypothetical protein